MLLTGWARAAGLRVAVVRAPDAAPLVREATTRLGAVLLAAGFDTVEVAWRSRSERVVFPWSTWAMMQKLRVRATDIQREA